MKDNLCLDILKEKIINNGMKIIMNTPNQLILKQGDLDKVIENVEKGMKIFTINITVIRNFFYF